MDEMKQIKIEYLDHMGSDLSIVNSARVSFDKQSDPINMEFFENGKLLRIELKEKDKKLINYLAKHKHTTPFRHNQIMIRCSAPIFLARQLGKHQAGLSWNEVSRRYVDSTPEFYSPPEWRGRPKGSIKQGSSEAVPSSDAIYSTYEGHIEKSIELYNGMLQSGVAPELARMVLPQSMITTWIWSGNLLAFAHVYKERSSEGAQLEAQNFAKKLHEVIEPLFPYSWKALLNN